MQLGQEKPPGGLPQPLQTQQVSFRATYSYPRLTPPSPSPLPPPHSCVLGGNVQQVIRLQGRRPAYSTGGEAHSSQGAGVVLQLSQAR